MPRTNWSTEARKRALELYAEHGAAHAARVTGIPVGTIKAWSSRGAAVLPRAEAQERVIEARKRDAADRRSALIEKLSQVAELGVDATLAMLNGEGVPLRDVVGAWTRAIHDLQLLSGDATQRTETRQVDDLDAEIADLLEQMRRHEARTR